MNTSPLYSPMNSPLEIGMVVITPRPLFGKGCSVRWAGRDCRAGVSIGTDEGGGCAAVSLFSFGFEVDCEIVPKESRYAAVDDVGRAFAAADVDALDDDVYAMIVP